jgi:hypothetical protein
MGMTKAGQIVIECARRKREREAALMRYIALAQKLDADARDSAIKALLCLPMGFFK